VDVEYRKRPVYTRKARGKGWELTVLEPRRRRDADYQHAENGSIPLLAREYRWEVFVDSAAERAC
jgi:hypothetical protein